eukprot:gnl/MRDRNA2_/MRDRNA2_136941_c0_seq1.p1 gnl/MRDRNA2_/MRDRNA2_136941_c0~~gnl/MRDRNA2_/MRDRNA2_136941_c0_seq1.p1  ORF type:complete len:508 (+),score=117.62 gnl/MRDRNA2_/MRDRNA2_136941_c0_seq1:60-1583(+)
MDSLSGSSPGKRRPAEGDAVPESKRKRGTVEKDKKDLSSTQGVTGTASSSSTIIPPVTDLLTKKPDSAPPKTAKAKPKAKGKTRAGKDEAAAAGDEKQQSRRSQETHDSGADVLRRKIAQELIKYPRGQCDRATLEGILATPIPEDSPALIGFIVDRSLDTVRITGEMSAHLESPSFQVAALREEYWQIGEATLQAGMDFDSGNDDKFNDLFEELMMKREELRQAMAEEEAASDLPYGEDISRLGTPSEDEKKLHDAVVQVLLRLREKKPWPPLSRVLEDQEVSVHRCAVPKGLKFWEWMYERLGNDISMVTNGVDLLVNYRGSGHKMHLNSTELDARRKKLSLAVYNTLVENGTQYPDSVGLSVTEINRIPDVAKMQFSSAGALRMALEKLPQTFEISATGSGAHLVRLRPGGVGPNGEKITSGRPSQRPAVPQSKIQQKDVGAVQQKDAGARTVEQWSKAQEEEFRHLPALPDGWLRAKSRTHGKIYYVNKRTGQSQFDMPTATA